LQEKELLLNYINNLLALKKPQNIRYKMKSFKNKFFIILTSVLLISFFSFGQEHHKKEHKVHWGYTGEYKPDNWSKLKPDYELCGNGTSQSPIDLVNPISSSLTSINSNYKPSLLNIINNGHTIQVNYSNGSYAMIDGQKYTLLQFHFHTPSEHTVNGKHFDMEMHMVHKDKDGNLAVVGILIKIGKENPNFSNIVKHISAHKSDAMDFDEIVDVNSILPGNKSFYHYYGSLTTPNCAEGVNWSVLTTHIEISKTQFDQFHNVMGNNNRPIQPLNKRFLLISE